MVMVMPKELDSDNLPLPDNIKSRLISAEKLA